MIIYNKKNIADWREIEFSEACPKGYTRTIPGNEITGKVQMYFGGRWIYINNSTIIDREIEIIKQRNSKKAAAALEEIISIHLKNQTKKSLGLEVAEPAEEDLIEYVSQLDNDIKNPPTDQVYNPPLPPGVIPPAVAAITAHITREPGWNSVLGYRLVLEISDPEYIPANLALAVYSSANCTGYLYTTGAFQFNSADNTYFSVCPPGQEKGNVAYHFGLLYGAAQLSCWTLAAGEQTQDILIYGE